MSILGPLCRNNSGLPIDDVGGPPTGVANMHLYVADGDVEVINNGTQNHYGAGLPFNVLGLLVIAPGAIIAYYDQGLPFSSTGNPVTGAGPVDYVDQGVAFNAAGEIVTI